MINDKSKGLCFEKIKIIYFYFVKLLKLESYNSFWFCYFKGFYSKLQVIDCEKIELNRLCKKALPVDKKDTWN